MTPLPLQYHSPPLRDGSAAGSQAEHSQHIADASAEEGQQHQQHQVLNSKNSRNQGLEAWKSMGCILQELWKDDCVEIMMAPWVLHSLLDLHKELGKAASLWPMGGIA